MLGVLGAGSWGTSLALQACRSGQPVCLWEHDAEVAKQLIHDGANKRYLPDFPFPQNLNISSDLDCVKDCSEVLVVVPSTAFRHVIERLQPLLKYEQGLAWATKGLDPQQGELLNQVAASILGDDFPAAVLSGPSFALEVAQQKPTAISLAANNHDLAHRIVQRLHGDSFRIYTCLLYTSPSPRDS